MRKEDLSKAIGNIDPKIIESSFAYKPAMSKHRLTKIVALAACIAVLVTAIPLALILNRENGNADDLPVTTNDNTVIDNTEPEKEEPLIIFCSSPTELKQQMKADANVEIKDVAERKEFSLSVNDTVVDKKSGTPYVKTVTIGNETFEISYEESKATETFESLSTHLKAYASLDRYSTLHKDDRFQEGLLSFKYSQETGKLIEYFKSMAFVRMGDLGEEELHKLALEEINNLYDIDIAKDPNYRYECRHHPAKSTYHPEEEYYQIIYRRYINGYATDECIYVCLDTSGQILSISQNLGLYDEVAKSITTEKLEAAQKQFFDSISDSSVVQENVCLKLDNFGKCSMVFEVKDYVQIQSIFVEIG